jgi:hypothetical protein
MYLAGSIMVLALIVILLLILFLIVIIAGAASTAGGESEEGSTRELRPRSSPELPAGDSSSLPPYSVTDATEAENFAGLFAPVGRMISPMEDPLVSHEGAFVAANKPFKVGSRNDGEGAICFVTGEPKTACRCAECLERRSHER